MSPENPALSGDLWQKEFSLENPPHDKAIFNMIHPADPIQRYFLEEVLKIRDFRQLAKVPFPLFSVIYFKIIFCSVRSGGQGFTMLKVDATGHPAFSLHLRI